MILARRIRETDVLITFVGDCEYVIERDEAVALASQIQLAVADSTNKKRRQVTGLIARCQCGVIIGAADYARTDRKELGQIAGQWIADGCVIEPQFKSSWNVNIEACRCERQS